jgi:hypothetical protein
MTATDRAVHQTECMPRPLLMRPSSWDMAWEKSSRVQTKSHLDITVFLSQLRRYIQDKIFFYYILALTVFELLAYWGVE